MSDTKWVVKFEFGHHSHQISAPDANDPEKRTHQWTVYCKGVEGMNSEILVDRTIFDLHRSFENPRRTLSKPPFEVTEKGYASCDIGITIALKYAMKELTYKYDLILKYTKDDHAKVVQHFEIKDPIRPEARALLLKAGAERASGKAKIHATPTATTPSSDATMESLFGEILRVPTGEKKPSGKPMTSASLADRAKPTNAVANGLGGLPNGQTAGAETVHRPSPVVSPAKAASKPAPGAGDAPSGKTKSLKTSDTGKVDGGRVSKKKKKGKKQNATTKKDLPTLEDKGPSGNQDSSDPLRGPAVPTATVLPTPDPSTSVRLRHSPFPNDDVKPPQRHTPPNLELVQELIKAVGEDSRVKAEDVISPIGRVESPIFDCGSPVSDEDRIESPPRPAIILPLLSSPSTKAKSSSLAAPAPPLPPADEPMPSVERSAITPPLNPLPAAVRAEEMEIDADSAAESRKKAEKKQKKAKKSHKENRDRDHKNGKRKRKRKKEREEEERAEQAAGCGLEVKVESPMGTDTVAPPASASTSAMTNGNPSPAEGAAPSARTMVDLQANEDLEPPPKGDKIPPVTRLSPPSQSGVSCCSGKLEVPSSAAPEETTVDPPAPTPSGAGADVPAYLLDDGYLDTLISLQRRIMCVRDQRTAQMIAEVIASAPPADIAVNQNSLDFDLCSLKPEAVRKLADCLSAAAMASDGGDPASNS